MRPIVMTIAGSDPCGGAGIQADIKTIEANGGYATSVLTAVTVQSTRGVSRSLVLGGEWVAAQLEAVFSDLSVGAVKSGMLGDEPVVDAVARVLRKVRPAHYVCDPVLRSTSGHALLAPGAVARLVRSIMPLATLITPNADEAAVLSSREVRNVGQARDAGRALLDSGARAVLITGGHLDEDPGTDVLIRPEGEELFRGEFLDATHTHGTGCVLSSAIATQLAHGRGLDEAIRRAKWFVTQAMRNGLDLGDGIGPTDPFFFLQDRPADLSKLPGDGSCGGEDR